MPLSSPERGGTAFLIALILLAGGLVSIELGRMDVALDNEGQRATPPAEMLRSGDYIIPTINGDPYLSKPPLLYWAIAGVYSLTGRVSAVNARIPTALSFVAIICMLYVLARRETGEAAARWAALAMLASPYVLERARWACIDIPLVLAVMLAIWGFWAACRARGTGGMVLRTIGAGVATGCAIMLKGPPVLIFAGAACLAFMGAHVEEPLPMLRTGLRGTAGVLILAGMLWGLGFVATVPFPVALVLAVILWAVLAWRHTTERIRPVLILAGMLIVGAGMAVPWASAVLTRMGWENIAGLLDSEVATRTHTATAINSGSPVYYALGLPLMLAPWGFLLPMHFSKDLFVQSGRFLRFCVLMGWMSVATFSLIAGKEYEYVLPVVPFLLIVTGNHMNGFAKGELGARFMRWGRIWRDVAMAVLAVALVAGGGYVFATGLAHPLLLAEVGLLVALGIVAGMVGWRRENRRLVCIAAMTLAACGAGVLSRSYHYTGDHSPQEIAEKTGALLREGYQVEAVKMTSAFDVYPAFAFYAGVEVPTVTDPEHVLDKMQTDEPYFCVLRAKVLDSAPNLPPGLGVPLMGPYTSKRLILIGNVPLPETEPAAR